MRTLQNVLIIQSGKIYVPEEVISTSTLVFLSYGDKIIMLALKYFVVLTVLTGCVPKCPIIVFQFWGGVIQEYLVSTVLKGLALKKIYIDCNCNLATKLNGKFSYKGECLKCCDL